MLHLSDSSIKSMKEFSFIARLFVALLVVATLFFRAEGACPAHGCSITGVDILHDETMREALVALRKTEKNGDRSRDEATLIEEDQLTRVRNQALSVLKNAGDATKTTLTLRGYKGGKMEDQINQDRSIIVSPFHIFSPDTIPEPKPIAQLLGVFDGHGGGGEKTSQYAIDHIPSLLAAKLAETYKPESQNEKENNTEIIDFIEDSVVVRALKDVFLEMDRNDPTRGTAGCTATVVFRLGQKLFVANAGDSVSFIGLHLGGNSLSKNQVQIIYQSREDKPDLPDEAARIRSAGGYVHIPRTSDQDVPRAYFIDENGHARYGLAMSRSLGDWKVKGVIAEPIVDILDLHQIVQSARGIDGESCGRDEAETNEKDGYCYKMENDDIHVFAASISDGMMDYLTPNEVGKTLALAFFDEENGMHPHSAAEELIMRAAQGWKVEFQGQYRDDIAIASFVIPLIQHHDD